MKPNHKKPAKGKPVKRKKPSGAEYRKIRRARVLAAMEANGITTELIENPNIGDLKTVNDWHDQVADIYRRARSGQIQDHVATKFVYVCNVGASLAKVLEELKELISLRQQLAALQSGENLVQAPLNGSAQEYLPADNAGDRDIPNNSAGVNAYDR